MDMTIEEATRAAKAITQYVERITSGAVYAEIVRVENIGIPLSQAISNGWATLTEEGAFHIEESLHGLRSGWTSSTVTVPPATIEY
jgi:hypothetical protein